jgi:hypothetical protein
MRGEEMRKKFTTVLSEKTISALELIANREEMSGKNNVIEYLVREYIRDNDLEGVLNDKYKDNEQVR